MATLDIRPLLPAALEVANVRAHVARRRLLSLARAVVEVQANELVLFRLGSAIRWQVLQQLLHCCATPFKFSLGTRRSLQRLLWCLG